MKGLNQGSLVHMESRRYQRGSRWIAARSATAEGASACEGKSGFCWDMGDLVGTAPSPRATGVNASQAEDASVGVPSQVQLVLEVLVVLMCVAAVTGNRQKKKIFSFSFFLTTLFEYHLFRE